MRFRASRLLFLLCGFLYGSVKAQNSIEFSPLSGISVFSPGHLLLTGKSYGAELGYNFSMQQNPADWVKRLNIDAVGVTAGYRNMSQVLVKDSIGSKGFLGNVYTLSGKLNISLLKFKRTSLLLTPGAGITYSTSSFFTDGNPIVASRINFSPQFGLKIKTPLSASTSLITGANLFHYSNIALRVPNNGVNSFEVSLGLVKELKSFPQLKDSRINDDHVRSFFEFGADIGRRGSFKSYAGNWKSGLYLGYNYKLNPTISLKLAADAVYYYSVFDGSKNSDQYFATSFDPWRFGMSAGADVWLGEVAVTTSYGYYFKFDGPYDIKTYWHAGLKYYFNSWLGIQGKGYVHKVQADYLGFGLIFRFGQKNNLAPTVN
ncbi:MAG TPA: acyloxyacyl hydrolase [Sphingobacteriaceae bacterium]|nr:acyloxyacyl hydrolase [Sphingobacteriaceae bacterium]